MANDKAKTIDFIMKMFQEKSDIGGLVVQKNGDSIEYDGFFSDEFIGMDASQGYSTMIAVIAAIRSMSDAITEQVSQKYEIANDEVKKDIAEMYYSMRKLHEDESHKNQEN